MRVAIKLINVSGGWEFRAMDGKESIMYAELLMDRVVVLPDGISEDRRVKS